MTQQYSVDAQGNYVYPEDEMNREFKESKMGDVRPIVYSQGMYQRSKRFKEDNLKQPYEEYQEIQKRVESGDKGELVANGWQKVSADSPIAMWRHPKVDKAYPTPDALNINNLMGQGDSEEQIEKEEKELTEEEVKDVLNNPYASDDLNVKYWRDKYCEKSDEVENLRKTLFEYEGEMEALREESGDPAIKELSKVGPEKLEGMIKYLEGLTERLNQKIREKDNQIHYLQVEVDNYKILMNENKDLDEDPAHAQEEFNTSLENTSDEHKKAFEDMARNVVDWQRKARARNYSPDLNLDEELYDYETDRKASGESPPRLSSPELDKFLEKVQEVIPNLDYFSTPYTDGSTDDLLHKISHLSEMYEKFNYGARGDEYRKGYFGGWDEATQEANESAHAHEEMAAPIVDYFMDKMDREIQKARSTPSYDPSLIEAKQKLENQKAYTKTLYEANNKLQAKIEGLQKKLGKARTFLSSWEDEDNTLWDTFQDYLEGKYDLETGEWK